MPLEWWSDIRELVSEKAKKVTTTGCSKRDLQNRRPVHDVPARYRQVRIRLVSTGNPTNNKRCLEHE